MLILTQDESNLIYWCKGHYQGRNHENYWPQLAEIYKEWGDMDEFDLVGTYWMVRNLWQKILEVLPNKENLLEAYENDTLPSNVRMFRGAPNYGNTKWNCDDKFSGEDIVKARIVVMCSQIKLTKVKYYELLPKQEFAGLKLVVDNAGE